LEHRHQRSATASVQQPGPPLQTITHCATRTTGTFAGVPVKPHWRETQNSCRIWKKIIPSRLPLLSFGQHLQLDKSVSLVSVHVSPFKTCHEHTIRKVLKINPPSPPTTLSKATPETIHALRKGENW